MIACADPGDRRGRHRFLDAICKPRRDEPAKLCSMAG
jgi:hypothetical protein